QSERGRLDAALGELFAEARRGGLSIAGRVPAWPTHALNSTSGAIAHALEELQQPLVSLAATALSGSAALRRRIGRLDGALRRVAGHAPSHVVALPPLNRLELALHLSQVFRLVAHRHTLPEAAVRIHIHSKALSGQFPVDCLRLRVPRSASHVQRPTSHTS